MINFESLPKENPFGLPEPGVYKAVIVEADMKANKDPNKPEYLNLKYSLTDAKGRSAGNMYDIIAESDSSVVQYKIGRFVRACGIPLVGAMSLNDLCKIVKGRSIVVDIAIDDGTRAGGNGKPKAVVDLFTRQAYYLPSEFNEINNLVNPPLGEINDFAPSDDAEVPFNAVDGNQVPSNNQY